MRHPGSSKHLPIFQTAALAFLHQRASVPHNHDNMGTKMFVNGVFEFFSMFSSK